MCHGLLVLSASARCPMWLSARACSLVAVLFLGPTSFARFRLCLCLRLHARVSLFDGLFIAVDNLLVSAYPLLLMGQRLDQLGHARLGASGGPGRQPLVAGALLLREEALAIRLDVGNRQLRVVLTVALGAAVALLRLVLEDDDFLAAGLVGNGADDLGAGQSGLPDERVAIGGDQ